MAQQGRGGTFVVVTGGDPLGRVDLAHLPLERVVIAADSGVDRALAVGLHVDVAVGDFDSVSAGGLTTVADAGAVVESHPTAKDETDLELALDAAVTRGARRIHVLGGRGGRLDHLLGNALLLASTKYASVDVTAQMGDARITVVREHAVLTGFPPELVSLLAVHGPATGVATDGLLYPLADEELLPGSSRGLSNELISAEATVRLRGGVLLVVQTRSTDSHQEGTFTA